MRIQLRRDVMQHALHVGPATGFGYHWMRQLSRRRSGSDILADAT